MMRIKRLSLLLAAAVTALCFLAGTAGAVLKDRGPATANDAAYGGYPVWYRDFTSSPGQFFFGLPLELCTSQATLNGGDLCTLLADATFDPALPAVFPTNWPGEMFYWTGDAAIDVPAGGALDTPGSASLGMALEAAFGGGVPLADDQMVFSRIRIRIDVPVSGTYTVTHPFGVEVFDVAPGSEGIKGINMTRDIGLAVLDFDAALAGDVGPFLLCDAGTVTVGAETFIADPAVACTVTNSTPGADVFRVQGPAGSNLGGAGVDFLETDQFFLSGKIYTDAIPSALAVDRATYYRDATSGGIDVFVTADLVSNVNATTALEVSGTGFTTEAMVGDGLGSYYAHIAVADPANVPATVDVTNTADVPPLVVTVPLVDEVNNVSAAYVPATQTLTIQAESGDRFSPPTLSTAEFGDLANGSLVVPGVTVPPTSVTVTSAEGGTDSETVIVSPAAAPAATTAVALAPSKASPQIVGASITWVASASGGSGTYEYQFQLNGPGTGNVWQVVQPYGASGSWTWSTAIGDIGNSTVSVYARSQGSNAAFQAFAVQSYTVANLLTPPTQVALVASPASPQVAGAAVTWIASASGGTGPYDYQFWFKGPNNGNTWQVVQNYGSANSWTWNTVAGDIGSSTVSVYARNRGSSAASEAVKVASYTVTGALTPPTSATLVASPASPQAVGSPVTFTANGVGGSGTYEYQFWLNGPSTGNAWTPVRAYSASNRWDWTTTGLPTGCSTVSVYVRNRGSSAAQETFKVLGYTLTP